MMKLFRINPNWIIPIRCRLASLLIVGCLIGIGHGPFLHAAEPSRQQKRVLSTLFPLHLFTKKIVGKVSSIQLMMLSQSHRGCLHDYHLNPQDAKWIGQADLVIINGDELHEGPLKRLLVGLSPGVLLNTSTAILDRLETSKWQKRVHQEDAHYFGDPALARLQASQIVKRLVYLNSKHKQEFLSNYKSLLHDFDDLMNRLDALQALTRGVRVMTMRDSLDYFARACGFRVVPILKDSEGHIPSAKEVALAPKRVEDNKVRFILTDPNFPSRYASQLAKTTSARLVLIDPVASGPRDAASDYYYRTMVRNITHVEKVLKAKAP